MYRVTFFSKEKLLTDGKRSHGVKYGEGYATQKNGLVLINSLGKNSCISYLFIWHSCLNQAFEK